MSIIPQVSTTREGTRWPASPGGVLGVPSGEPAFLVPPRGGRYRACHTMHISNTSFFLGGSGTVVQLRVSGKQGQVSRGGKRGRVEGFSAGSRRRLMKRLFAVEWEVMDLDELYFVTLTYHRIPEDGREVKRHLDMFFTYLDRLFGRDGWGCVWKQEFQKRGAVHFHLLLRVLRVPWRWLKKFPEVELGDGGFLFMLRQWTSKVWNRLAEPGDEEHERAGTNVQRVKNLRQLMAYLIKYVGKPQEVPEGTANWGRFWGFRREDLFPMAWEAIRVSQDEFFRLRRILRRYAGLRGRGGVTGLTVFAGFRSKRVYRKLVDYILSERKKELLPWEYAWPSEGVASCSG